MAIEPDKDFYWDMPTEVVYDMKVDKPEINVGRLSDDWEFLSKINDDPEQAVALMLIHAAPLLRYVGEKVGR